MTSNTSIFHEIISSIPSYGTRATAEAYRSSGLIHLLVAASPAPGQTVTVQVSEHPPINRDPGRFEVSVDDGGTSTVEGTGDMDNWRSDGRPLPFGLETHRAIVVRAIEAAAEAARLFEKVDASKRRRTTPPAPEPTKREFGATIRDILFGAPKPPTKQESTRELLKKYPPTAAGDPAADRLIQDLSTGEQ
jgi:hypothetical protein